LKIEAQQIPEGCDFVLRVDRPITAEAAARVREHAMAQLPGRNVLVLGPEVEIEFLPDMKRIEEKVDTLIAALAAEGEEDPPVRSLDNGRTFAARDDKRGLG
jgi:hypothetical protein